MGRKKYVTMELAIYVCTDDVIVTSNPDDVGAWSEGIDDDIFGD